MSTLDVDETQELIASDKVEGTAVYNLKGERLGTISNVMIGKRDGQVDYAVLSFGGFLGIGTDHYPIPWEKLDYDVERGGYVVDLDQDLLRNAPRYASEERPEYSRDYAESINNYYGVPYY